MAISTPAGALSDIRKSRSMCMMQQQVQSMVEEARAYGIHLRSLVEVVLATPHGPTYLTKLIVNESLPTNALLESIVI